MIEYGRLLTVKEVAESLRISRGSVYELVKQGRLGVHRVGSGRGTIRVAETDLSAYLASCRSGKIREIRESAAMPSRRRLKHISVSKR